VAAANLVAKIIAFEQRSPDAADGALFVSSLMNPFWKPGDMYPNFALNAALGLRDQALARRPSLRAGTLFQGDQGGDPNLDPLNPASLADSLGARPHDFIFIQLNGAPETWELAGGLPITSEDLAGIADCGHSFLAAMISGDVADTRSEQNILTQQMILPDGGAVGVVAPGGVVFLSFTWNFQESLWQHMLDDSAERLGDAFDLAQADYLDNYGTESSVALSNYYSQALLGDPATLLRAPEAPAMTPSVVMATTLHAAPNPFNPQTSLHFEVPDTGADRVPVRLQIFDLHGRLVETLIDGTLEAGPRSVVWGGTAAAGVYLARLQVDGREETTKLTLVD